MSASCAAHIEMTLKQITRRSIKKGFHTNMFPGKLIVKEEYELSEHNKFK